MKRSCCSHHFACPYDPDFNAGVVFDMKQSKYKKLGKLLDKFSKDGVSWSWALDFTLQKVVCLYASESLACLRDSLGGQW
jgi:hypothetical protein